MADSTSSLSEFSKATLSANTTLSSNLGQASSAYSSISTAAEEDIGSLIASAFQTLRSTGFDGVVGLELSQVDNMKRAITDYVDSIKTALSPLNASDAKTSFGKEIAPKIEEFVTSVKQSCEAVISNMEAFNEDLEAVRTAMKAKAQSVNTALGTQASNLAEGSASWKYSGSNESN